MNPEKPHKLAVLIDADNASASAVSGLFAEIAKYGIASVKRIYGDWSRPEPQGWKKDVLLRHALVPVQQFAYTTGKDATDMSLIIDAMELLYSGIFDGFCLVQRQRLHPARQSHSFPWSDCVRFWQAQYSGSLPPVLR